MHRCLVKDFFLVSFNFCFPSVSSPCWPVFFWPCRTRVECELASILPRSGLFQPGWSMINARGALEALPRCTQPRWHSSHSWWHKTAGVNFLCPWRKKRRGQLPCCLSFSWLSRSVLWIWFWLLGTAEQLLVPLEMVQHDPSPNSSNRSLGDVFQFLHWSNGIIREMIY